MIIMGEFSFNMELWILKLYCHKLKGQETNDTQAQTLLYFKIKNE